jgi:CRISPR-associated protein Csy2
MSQFLVIRRLHIRCANSISSSLTYGFPAVSAFLGFGHALQRRFGERTGNADFRVNGVGIVSHRFEMQDHQDGYSRILKLTANPLNERGERSSFVEEGRCHLTVSLVLEVDGLRGGETDLELLSRLVIGKMKLAGGDILTQPEIRFMADDRAAIRLLMPGYALLDRRDLMVEAMEDGTDALQALHRFLEIRHQAVSDEDGKVSWVATRHRPGWFVPIAVGFHAVSPIGQAVGARDPSVPHCFAESLVSLGEFVLASRMDSLSEILWRYQASDGIYACTQAS